MPEPTKFLLSEADIPSRWINLLPDLPGEIGRASCRERVYGTV